MLYCNLLDVYKIEDNDIADNDSMVSSVYPYLVESARRYTTLRHLMYTIWSQYLFLPVVIQSNMADMNTDTVLETLQHCRNTSRSIPPSTTFTR